MICVFLVSLSKAFTDSVSPFLINSLIFRLGTLSLFGGFLPRFPSLRDTSQHSTPLLFFLPSYRSDGLELTWFSPELSLKLSSSYCVFNNIASRFWLFHVIVSFFAIRSFFCCTWCI